MSESPEETLQGAIEFGGMNGYDKQAALTALASLRQRQEELELSSVSVAMMLDLGPDFRLTDLETAVAELFSERDSARTQLQQAEQELRQVRKAKDAAKNKRRIAQRSLESQGQGIRTLNAQLQQAEQERDAADEGYNLKMYEANSLQRQLQQAETALRNSAEAFHGLDDDPEHTGSWLYEGHENLPACQNYHCVNARAALAGAPPKKHSSIWNTPLNQVRQEKEEFKERQ